MYMFSRAWNWLHVFPCLALVTCFPVLCMVTCTCFPALGTGYMFFRAWHWLHVFLCFAWLHVHVFPVVMKTCILQHTPLFITNGLYQPVKLLCISSYKLGFIGTYENLERSVTLQHILFIYEFRVTQHYTAISRTFSKVTLHPLFFIKN